jgi:prepilin-type N-terminal cleavage/methylation domain-containing protein
MNKVVLNPNKSLTVEFDHLRPIHPIDREFIAKHVCVKMYEGKVLANVPYSDYPEKEFWVLDEHNDWFLTFDNCGDEDEGRSITIRHRNPEERHLHILGGLGFKLVDMNLVVLPSSLVDNEEPKMHGGSDAIRSGFTLMELVVATAILFTILVVFVKLGAWAASLISW